MERYERVVVTQDSMEDLKKYCRVLNPSSSETWKDYTVFNKVTWLGKAAPSVIPEGWIVLGINPPKELIVPEMTLDWFKKNSQTLSALCEIITCWKMLNGR